MRARLVGSASFQVQAERLTTQLADGFFHLEVVDETVPLSAASLQEWAADDTVLGLFVRRMQAHMDGADLGRRAVLEQGLHRGIHALRQGGGVL